MICPKCGHRNVHGDMYCSECGTKLSANKPKNNDVQLKAVIIVLVITVILTLLTLSAVVGFVVYKNNTSSGKNGDNIHNVAEVTEEPENIVSPVVETIAPATETSAVETIAPAIETKRPIKTYAPEKTEKNDGRYEKKEEFRERAKAIENYSERNLETAMAQSEINYESGVVLDKWDELLNDVYQYLKKILPADEFEELKKDEIAWIKEKEKAADEAAAEWEGGSGAPMIWNTTALDYTRDRCYYLISLIN